MGWDMLKAVELFAGAGGLGLGASLAGFEAAAVLERDRWACDTIRENQRRDHPLVRNWPLTECDVRDFDFSSFEDRIDLLTGGPPCQPFSMGGKHRAHLDDRDMFPVTADIIRRVRPKAFLVENVRGLTRPTFANYFQYILLQLEMPQVVIKDDEEWEDHFKRLQKEKTSGLERHRRGLTYNVVWKVVNAADYGVPQRRERVFIVGFRSDLGIRWAFPEPTHSQEQLLREQFITGEYWDRHGTRRPQVPAQLARRVERLRQTNGFDDTRPWVSVRDALVGLPEPSNDDGATYLNHRFQDGARVYPGHTGSPLDSPAKTLKAGDHGVPGGENMMVRDDGSVRYFSVRESARLQTFPDTYVFHGSWTETMRQLGNAVPVSLAHRMAGSIAEKLLLREQDTLGKLLMSMGRA